MVRQAILITDVILTIAALILHVQQISAPQLVEVATFEKYQPTGVAVSSGGRVFVNFPLWSDEHEHSVAEVLPDGRVIPFPNERWNSWRMGSDVPVTSAFVSVQALWVDRDDRLWILDPASPRMEGVVPGAAKLVKVNLSTNQVERVYSFTHEVAPRESYLNDVRVDPEREFAYVTESGLGAIVVLNLDSGHARRLLHDHESTKAEDDVTLTVEGKDVRDDQGRTPAIHADGIALSNDREHLYYHALTGEALYRIPTRLLRDETLSSEDVHNGVERVAKTVVTDGMIIDRHGNVYHTALEENAIVRYTPEGKMETVVKDQRIRWPDSMALHQDRDGNVDLYFTTSQIHHMPRFNDGEDARTEPYHVFKIRIEDAPQRAVRE